jgi:putative oxidoreductase
MSFGNLPRSWAAPVLSILPRSWAGPLLSVLRIMTGLLFLEVGTGKLIGFPHLPFSEPPTMLYFTGMMEFVGGVLITLGLFTRPAAFVLSGYMAVAYFWAHARRVSFP